MVLLLVARAFNLPTSAGCLEFQTDCHLVIVGVRPAPNTAILGPAAEPSTENGYQLNVMPSEATRLVLPCARDRGWRCRSHVPDCHASGEFHIDWLLTGFGKEQAFQESISCL
jgi:hypothetical protein